MDTIELIKSKVDDLTNRLHEAQRENDMLRDHPFKLTEQFHAWLDSLGLVSVNKAEYLALREDKARLLGLLSKYTSGHAEESSSLVCTCCERRTPFCAPDCAVMLEVTKAKADGIQF